MTFDFRKPVLEDREMIQALYREMDSRSCEDTFTNLYLWNRVYPTDFAMSDGMMVLLTNGYFHFPIGAPDPAHIRSVVEKMMDYAREQEMPFRMGVVTPREFGLLEEIFPGIFQIEYDRDSADYVYEREKLATLSGKKYHGKKNHVNKFQRLYPDWQYEPITEQNVEECFKMAMKWRNLNGCEDGDEEKRLEVCVTMNALRLMKELHLTGGCLRVNGEIAAFTLGERLSSDTFVVHIEKALADVEGAYTMINQQFVQHEMEGFTYVNREEDTGDEGLRRAKLSYKPVLMVEKGVLTLKDEEICYADA